MVIVGICGASGSGKSTFCRNIRRRLELPSAVLPLDTYYRDASHLSPEERRRLNFDAPESFELEDYCRDIRALKAGRSVPRRGYDYVNHCRKDPGGKLRPAPVLLLEGIHVFYDKRVRSLCDLKVFLQVDPDLCLLRRIARDLRDRGRTIEDISRQYLSQVKPMYEQHVRPAAQHCDLLVPGGGQNLAAAQAVAAHILRLAGVKGKAVHPTNQRQKEAAPSSNPTCGS